MWRPFSITLCLAAGCAFAIVASLPTAAQAPSGSPEARAVAFLAREVPRWRREHPCYSCHNNGDATRALITAARKGHTIGDALDDTLVWLRDPQQWNDKMPQGGIDDKPLARIQFASALRLAVDTGRAPRAALQQAAAFVVADQKPDGSWQLDSSQSLGSPTTYGTTLATAAALRTLRATHDDALAPAITKGNAWLRAVTPETVVDAAALLLGLEDGTDAPARAARAHGLEVIRKGQAPNGGWGPFVTSPPEVFDTALVVIALAEAAHGRDRATPVFAEAELRSALARGRDFLVQQQSSDGSWPETTRPTGQESYAQRISTTGWALLALLNAFENP